MGLLSEKNKEVLLGPLSVNNPVVVQMLGICSALAVMCKDWSMLPDNEVPHPNTGRFC